MNEIAYERASVATRVHGWREMLAQRNTRGCIIKTMCPGLTVGANLEQHVVDLLTTDCSPSEGQSIEELATEAALSA